MSNLTRVLYVIHQGTSENTVQRVQLLRQAALERSVAFCSIDSLSADYTNLPQLNRGDMLFNCSRGSTMLETMLTIPGISTFRTASPRWIENGGETVVFSAVCERHGLPAPRTVYHLPSCDDQLWKYVDYLGGLPVVLKACGATRGLGLICCSDEASLLSTVDFLRSLDRAFIMREYVLHDSVLRVVVLGERVLCTLKMAMRKQDFRSAIDGSYELCDQPNEAACKLAIAAAKACEYEFCGVDIINHAERGPLLLESNPPSNFDSIREKTCLLYTSPSPRDRQKTRMPSSA